MKKIIVLTIIILLITILNNKTVYDLNDEIIRFRIIPNSNNTEDLEIKEQVFQGINKELEFINDSKSIEESRTRINNSIEKINDNIDEIFKKNKYNYGYNVSYGLNYFPEKKYKENKYPEGEYESLVITLGSGKGDNFWCIMFPPLCLIEENDSDNVQYKFFLTKIIDKIIK